MAQEQQKIVEHPVKQFNEDGSSLFDTRVKIVDEKTGRIVKYQPYAYHVSGADKIQLYERPIGSGNMFDGNDKPIGNYQFDKTSGGMWKKVSDEHVAVKAQPSTEKEALQEELRQAKQELELAKKELEAKEALKVQVHKKG